MKKQLLTPAKIKKLVVDTLDSRKAIDIKTIDVRKIASFTDYLVICTGTSSRHVKALAGHVIEKIKEHHHAPYGVEGERDAEWILVDLIDVVVHIMSSEARSFYNLEKLWGPRGSKK